MKKIDTHTPVSQRRQAIENIDKLRDPPEGISLNPAELAVFKQLMRARPYDSWSSPDLLAAAKAARMEVLIRRGYIRLETLIDEGCDPFDSESMACEYLENIGKAQKTQLTILRSIGVTRTAISVKNARKHIDDNEAAAEAKEAFKQGSSNITMLAVN